MSGARTGPRTRRGGRVSKNSNRGDVIRRGSVSPCRFKYSSTSRTIAPLLLSMVPSRGVVRTRRAGTLARLKALGFQMLWGALTSRP